MYDKIAKDLRIKEEFRDDVFKLAEYEPDGDEVDEKKIREHFSKFLSERKGYLDGGDKEPKSLPKGEGATRGARDPGFGGGDARPEVTRAQLKDPNFTAKHASLLADPTSYELIDA